MDRPEYSREQVVTDMLSGIEDLSTVERAVAREREIRIMMARSGQGRGPAADMVDAEQAMAEEAVLDLTDGEPTTLVDALQRYLSELACRGELQPRDQIATELETILSFPWSEDERLVSLHNPHYGLMLHFEHDENRDLLVKMGNNRWTVARVSWEDAGSGGVQAAETAIRAVYKATLARVLPDREHIVQLNRQQVENLASFLSAPPRSYGDFRPDRLGISRTSDGGAILSTRPYAYGISRDKSL